MLPLNLSKSKGNGSPKKESQKNSSGDERSVTFAPQAQSPNSETIVVVVMPCGREDGKNSQEEMPYEIKIRKKANENSLKEIFLRKPQYWEKIFKQHLEQEVQPNFSIYRKPFEPEQDPSKSDLFLHILYMKSSEKALSRNYNAQELELFCHNRFYGPLVVAYNINKQPYYLVNFSLQDLQNIEQINRNFQNKSIKDDYVPECLLDCRYLHTDLANLYKEIEVFTFYMFKYKTSWCPNKKDSHDSKSCIYAHHTRDFRRPPDLFKYLPEDCETLVKGVGWDKCDKGLKCTKCHTTVERLYHPDKYKRIFCDRSRCNKSEICAFYHTQKERSQANKECKNYRKSLDVKTMPDVNELHENLVEFYKNQVDIIQVSSIKTALSQENTKESQNQNNQSPHSGHMIEEFKGYDSQDMYQIQITTPDLKINGGIHGPISHSNLDQNSPLFQPYYRSQSHHITKSMMQQRPYFQLPNDYNNNQATQPQQAPIQNIPPQNMSQIQLMPNRYQDEKQQKSNQKMNSNYFEYPDYEEKKTRNSTFSKASEGRDEIQKNVVSFYDKAFVHESNGVGFYNPVYDDPEQLQEGLKTPDMNKQQSGKSPTHLLSPVILDFLEDDAFFDEAKRLKSKTEFVKRERQESEDSNQEEQALTGQASAYLNSILPNNFIKFHRPSQSRFSFSNKEKRP